MKTGYVKSAKYFFLFILFPYQAQSSAKTIYVDKQLATNSCSGNYSIANRNCSGTDGDAYKTFAGASAVAVAGDVVLIRAGTYNEQLAPQNSGTAGNYITFKNYGSEQVAISGNSLAPAVWVDRKNYIIIEGIKVHNVQRWLNALGCTYLIIQNNIFQNANDGGGSSKTGLFFQSSNYNKILSNVIDSTTQDNISLINSDYNLIEGNTITRGAHVLWTIKCGSYNVLRKNYFHNKIQKIGEIYDCDNVGYGSTGFPKITSLDDTKRNVVEDNVFALTSTPIDASPYAGIQYAAQHGIIRRNIFYNCIGPPIDITLYSGEAEYNYSNKIYNNVMYNNHFGGMQVPAESGSYTCYDNVFRNNILYKNNFVQYDSRWTWYDELDNKPLQIMIAGSSSVLATSTSVFDNNNIFSTSSNELYVVAYGDRTSSTNPSPTSLSWWQTNRADYFKSNLQSNPMFVDTAAKDFRLKSGSPMIDAARFLAKTIGAGTNSSTMVVDTPGYFMDGFGIAGLNGDTIQLQGQTQTAVITAINYTTNTLTLSTPLTWTSGQKLGLKYSGTAPDVGVYEYDSGVTGTITHNTSAASVSVYPNPSNGIFTIHMPENTNKNIIITDCLGQIVYSESNFTGSSKQVDLSGKEAGIYFIRAEDGKMLYTAKVLIQ